MNTRLDPFIDKDGLVKQWPSKRMNQLLVIEYLSSKFPHGSHYTESELNQQLKLLHTFGDWATLRRELCVLGYFDRDKSGMDYVRTEKE